MQKFKQIHATYFSKVFTYFKVNITPRAADRDSLMITKNTLIHTNKWGYQFFAHHQKLRLLDEKIMCVINYIIFPRDL